MSQHPNAMLTPRTSSCCFAAGTGASDAARQAGASRQTANEQIARIRRGKPSRTVRAGLGGTSRLYARPNSPGRTGR